MRARCNRVLLFALLVVSVTSAFAYAETVGVALWKADSLYIAGRSVMGPNLPEAALRALLAGPLAAEARDGVVSAIPPGTGLILCSVTDGRVVVDLTGRALANGKGDWEIEQIYRQVAATLRQFYPDLSVSLLVEGRPIASYAPPPPKIAPRPPSAVTMSSSGALAGRSITLSPGHGYCWFGTSWGTQRPGYCGYDAEDFHNITITKYLKAFLDMDGAVVKACRDIDQGAGNGPSGHAWWKEGAYVWLWHTGYPASVFAAYTGDDPPGSSSNSESNDDIRSRPLSSDYDNTDIYLSFHTNGYLGDCYGSGCPTGTETYYDAGTEHAAYGAVSQQLGNAVNGAIMAAVQGNVNNIPYGAWTCHGTCVKNSDGAYGEIRIPQRAATLTELAFHDSCDRDAAMIQDPFFQSVAMWGMYKGVCDYFGVSPALPVYGSQYVSDTIPAAMIGGRTVSVSVTFRNKGVVWQEARAFRLGAVGDSDPFASTRQTLSGTIGPNSTYTFTFNMTAPRTSGDYTTDWRMVRDGYNWFGETLTKAVHVDPPTDNEPPTAPTNLTAAGTGTTYIDLSWDLSTDNEVVTGYNIYRNSTKVKFVTGTSCRDTGLVPGGTYFYYVTAMDASSNESAPSNDASATTLLDITPPSAPTNVSALGITNSRIDVSWTASWDNLSVTKYKVYRDGSLVGQPTTTSYSDTGLATGSTHTYKIKAVDQSANESSFSAVAVGRTIDLGSTVLWSDNFESYASQAAFEVAWGDLTAPGLNWSAAQSSSPTHSAEEPYNTAMSSVHDLPSGISQISVGTFLEFRYYNPAGSNNARHYGQMRNYTTGGHTGTLSELWAIGSYSPTSSTYYSGRVAYGGPNWFSLGIAGTAGWHTMRIDITADTTNPITSGKGLCRFSVDGNTTSAGDNIACNWLPVTCLVLGSGLTSSYAGSYYYDDVKYGVQGTVQRRAGPNVSGVTSNSASITWITDVNSDSRVDYGTTPGYGSSATSGSSVKTHALNLTGLSPSTAYHFKVTSTASGKSDMVSGDYTFVTAAASVSGMKSLPDGASTGVCGVVISAALTNGFYVQDSNRTCGIKVLGTANAGIGDVVTVFGDLTTVAGERVLANAIVTKTSSGTAPKPLALTNKGLGGTDFAYSSGTGAGQRGVACGIGPNNIGLLVRTTGRVTAVSGTFFYADDGAQAHDASAFTGVRVNCDRITMPASGQYVAVSGISSIANLSGDYYRSISPRSAYDIQVIPAP